MRWTCTASLGAGLVWLWLASLPVEAQQHRATHLGNPATRFAPPLRQPEELRARFRDPTLRPDIASILRQWGWQGDLGDLFEAADTAPITEVHLPRGTRLPFMSSRNRGRPVVLRDVIWEGRQPIDAYVFVFNSNGRRYRCVTPKACSNFLLVDLGPVRPELELELTVPPAVTTCDPWEVTVLLRNAGHDALTGVRWSAEVPDGLAPGPAGSLEGSIPVLRVGEVRELRVPMRATVSGTMAMTWRAVSAEGGRAEASGSTVVRGPRLTLDCLAPPRILVGYPLEICLVVRNVGDAPDRVSILLPVPAGVTVVSASEGVVYQAPNLTWDLGEFGPGAAVRICATFEAPDLGGVPFTASAEGVCSGRLETGCEPRIVGVPAILLELVDEEDPVPVGGEVVYEIRVTNQGSAALTHVRPVGTVPALQEYVSSTGATPVRLEEGGRLVMEPVARLEPQATASWRVVTRALEVGIAHFRIDLTSDQLPRPFGELESTNQY